ncbi:MAG TPA: FdtA/QdtA family cupin domain-containing protein [Desulfobacteraceae bacterium]|jgi:dTDP-4-dehydrorhamnose 3,5-epimerase-like enzyme|nr:FdtA/QdtA family cupin domain-containing protein [Desulfobacteraceae bacterium]
MMRLVSDIHNCNVIELPRVHNRAGNITVFQNESSQPFNVRRVYYLYDVPGGAQRGGHAHKNIYQLIIAAGGSFDVILDDGINRKIVPLNRPYYGLMVVPGIWRELVNFSSGAVCMVLASEKYNPDDYIRDYDDFLSFRKEIYAGRS